MYTNIFFWFYYLHLKPKNNRYILSKEKDLLFHHAHKLRWVHTSIYPVGRIAEKAVCRSVFLEKKRLQTVFWRFCPLGMNY